MFSLCHGLAHNAYRVGCIFLRIPLGRRIVSGKYQVCVKKDYHDLADKALKIARKEYLSKKMKKFEWKTSIEGYLNLYSTLLQDRRKNRQIENHEEDQQMNRRLALSVL